MIDQQRKRECLWILTAEIMIKCIISRIVISNDI